MKNVVTENEKLVYNDGVSKIFLYTKGTKGGSKELKALLTYMESTCKEKAVDEELLQIQSIVDAVKGSDRERERYMKLYGVIDYEKRDSFEEGKQIGRELGLQEGHEFGLQEGIQGMISTCKSLGADRERAKEELKKNYALTDEMAEAYLKLYW